MRKFHLFLFFISLSFFSISCHYKAENVELTAPSSNSKIKQTYEGTTIVLTPENSIAALIFYPGAKVDYQSYYPLMKKCAEKNITCFLINMPFDYAFLNKNAADDCINAHPEIQKWYIAGHSLGGAMAAEYAGKNSSKLKGLIFLASYSTTDLSKTSLKVLSITASNDGVLNRKKYNKYKNNLPKDFKEIEIQGANHAGFGNYGPQKNDNSATISQEYQQSQTADFIKDFIN